MSISERILSLNENDTCYFYDDSIYVKFFNDEYYLYEEYGVDNFDTYGPYNKSQIDDLINQLHLLT